MANRFSIPMSMLLLAASGPAAMAADDGADASKDLMEQYCTKCHNLDDYAGWLDLEGFGTDNIHEAADIGEKVIKRLRAGMMPPVGEPRPDVVAMNAYAAALETDIDSHAQILPGSPGMHRLNRVEYQNAIRDLLALKVNPAEFFPSDDSSNGFDNQAGALKFSPALLEAYLSAATQISALAVGYSSGVKQTLYRVAEDANQNFRIDGLPFGTRGGIKFSHNFAVDGDYLFKTFAITLGNMGSDRPFGEIRGEQLEVLVDGELVKTFDWDSELGVTRNSFEQTNEEEIGVNLPTLDVTVPVRAGVHEIAVTFIARNYAPGLDMNNDFERSTIETGGLPGFTWYPHVGSVRVEGPFNVTGVTATPARQQLFSCYPSNHDEEAACARDIIAHFVPLAFRGYATQDDFDKLYAFFEQGRAVQGGFDEGIMLMLQRVLTDPKFIYRIESEPQQARGGETYALSDLDLASRLSFFLWSSIPDQELLDLANTGKLRHPAVLQQQVQRLFNDPKSEAFTANFAGQWLALRNLDAQVPVVNQFPDFDDLLRDSMRRETELVFDSLVRENRPLTDILTADYTFVNERLALHYGIPGIKGERFRRVELKGELAIRAGILGKASSLMVPSQPGRTSPVKRGFWVLASILGVEPPPPPPNVPIVQPKVADNAGNADVPSMREWMEGHRTNPACQGCHRIMDPIGFALESFDATGKFRVEENGKTIDTASTLYNGLQVEGAADLTTFLLGYQESLARNVTQKLLTYALGRGMEYGDMPLVRHVQGKARDDNYRFQSLIAAVVQSEAFLNNQKTADTTAAVAAE